MASRGIGGVKRRPKAWMRAGRGNTAGRARVSRASALRLISSRHSDIGSAIFRSRHSRGSVNVVSKTEPQARAPSCFSTDFALAAQLGDIASWPYELGVRLGAAVTHGSIDVRATMSPSGFQLLT